MSSLTSGIQLPNLAVDIVANTKGLSEGMDKATKLGVSKAEAMGKKLSAVGDKMTKTLTVPIVGLGTALGKMAMDYEKNVAKVSTLVDESSYSYKQLSEDVIEGSNKMKTSVDEYSEAVYQAISAGVDQKKAIDFTNQSIKLAKGGFTDASKAVDVLTTIINAYSLSADQATSISDKLVATQNLGKTTVDELASSMGKVIPTANAAGVNIDNVCTAMAQLTKNGIATAEATTYYNSMLNELSSSGTTADTALRELSGKGFKQLIQEGKPLTEILKLLQDKAEKSGQSLSDMFGSAEASKAALTIMKSDGAEYNDILEKMKNSAGSTEEAFKKIDSTASEQLAGAWNELKNAGIELGTALIPMIKEGAGMIKELAQWISGLSDSQKKSIVQIGLWVAALGPILSVGGKVIGTVGKIAGAFKGVSTAASVATGVSSVSKATGVAGLVGKLGALSAGSVLPIVAGVAAVGGAIYAVHEKNEYLNTSLSTTEEELPLLQKYFNETNGSIIKSREEMEALGLKYHEWSSDVSPEVAESVDATAEQFRNLNFEIDRLSTNNITIDESKATELKTQTKKVCDEIIDEIKSNASEAQKALGDYFKADGSTDSYETQVLSYFEDNQKYKVQLVQDYQAKIDAIYDKAYSEHRELYASETALVKDYMDKIGQIKIESASTTNSEYQELQANFQAKMEQMDLDGASQLMQEKAKLRDDEIAKTKEDYNTKINLLSMNLNNMNTAQRIAAEEEIRQLESERDEKIKTQEDTYNGYLKTIEENYPEIYKRIKFWNGEVMTAEEAQYAENLNKLTDHYSRLEEITESGMYKIYNTETKAYDSMYVKVDESTGKILGVWDKTTGEIEGYTKDTKDDLQDLAQNYDDFTEQSRQDLTYLIQANTNYTQKMAIGAKAVVNNLEDITRTADGTYQGILKVNGQDVTVTVNKDGTINDLQGIIDMMAKIPSVIHTQVLTTYTDANGNSFQASRYTSDGRGGYYYPGSYNGLENVPYDGYTARLHKDERVLTAEENAEYTANKTYGSRMQNGQITINSYLNLDGKIVGKSVNKVNGATMDMEMRQVGL